MVAGRISGKDPSYRRFMAVPIHFAVLNSYLETGITKCRPVFFRKRPLGPRDINGPGI